MKTQPESGKNKNFQLRENKQKNSAITLLYFLNSFDFPIVVSIKQYLMTGLSKKREKKIRISVSNTAGITLILVCSITVLCQ